MQRNLVLGIQVPHQPLPICIPSDATKGAQDQLDAASSLCCKRCDEHTRLRVSCLAKCTSSSRFPSCSTASLLVIKELLVCLIPELLWRVFKAVDF